jgi:D-alanine transaminase
MIVYYNGSFIDKSEVCISPDDRGFLFGDGTYEVIRVYNQSIFRLADHLNRLRRSLREIRMNDVDMDDLAKILNALVKKNASMTGDAAIYVQITRGIAARNHRFPTTLHPSIYAAIIETVLNPELRKNGVKIILLPDQRWGRCDIKSISLLANVLAAEEAHRQNAYEAVFIRDGLITEGTRTNIALIRDDTVRTHPLDHHILGGITRDVVLELCRKLKIPVSEQPFHQDQLLDADEIFIMGTTTEICPVIQVNDQLIHGGKPGPMTMKIQTVFRKLIDKGRI